MAESYRTSFFDLCKARDAEDSLAVKDIEIPKFQRDYAQGRTDASVGRIRDEFLDVLLKATTNEDGRSVGLDFVYGGVTHGTLQPLDGQQRLTTLFLLHWYVASRCDQLSTADDWTKFTYSTRESARMFCENLVKHRLPDAVVPSTWIVDQSWYQFLWRHDPTIQSMLVVLDSIHERFERANVSTAWSRLTDSANPAIWFLLLPLDKLAADGNENMHPEHLYIKMNSRGKPLTEFENFKAHFEKTIGWSERAREFADKIDTCWSDMLWHHRGDDGVIDDEFLRYLQFVTEVCEWRDGRTDGQQERLETRAQHVFGEPNPSAADNLDFLFKALDVWSQHASTEVFDDFFGTTTAPTSDVLRVPLFFRATDEQQTSDLFAMCCRLYGKGRGAARSFSLGQTLVLYAAILHLIEQTQDFPQRVRILRNLIEASSDELRPERMPKILTDAEAIVRSGDLDSVNTLNQAQVEDEKLKLAFLATNPKLRLTVAGLEDQGLLRGSLGAFELDADTFADRALTFENLMSEPENWPDVLAGLLAVGEYQRQRHSNSRAFLFGTDAVSNDSAWRTLLTGASRSALQQTREVLGEFLDRVAAVSSTRVEAMRAIKQEYLAACDADSRFDWRYYMVKYSRMRDGGSNTYYAERTDVEDRPRMGYSLCKLRPGRSALHSYYRDPYLLALQDELERPDALIDRPFSGYETLPRRMPLTQSGVTIRCVQAGFELAAAGETDDDVATSMLALARERSGAGEDNVVRVPQVEIEGRMVDTVDRIQLGAEVVGRLAAAGL